MKARKLLDALPDHVRNAWARHARLRHSLDEGRRLELEALDPDLCQEAVEMAAMREAWREAIEAEWRRETRSEARARRRAEAYSPP